MNRINVGDVCKAAKRRFGSTDKGDWEMLITQDERGHNDIVVFVSNRPSNVEENGCFRIDKINSVSYGNKKGTDGNWYASVSIDAEVSSVMTQSEYLKKVDCEEESWQDIPEVSDIDLPPILNKSESELE